VCNRREREDGCGRMREFVVGGRGVGERVWVWGIKFNQKKKKYCVGAFNGCIW